MAQPVEQDSRGIVDPAAGLHRFALDRHAPSGHLTRFVDRYWIVTWDLPPGQSYPQHVLPHPVVNLVIERGSALRRGHPARPDHQGAGGQRPRPGRDVPARWLQPARPRPRSAASPTEGRTSSTGSGRPPASGRTTSAESAAEADQSAMVAAADRFLGARLPTASHQCEAATALIEQVVADPSLLRVETLADWPRKSRSPPPAAVRRARRRLAQVGDPPVPDLRGGRADPRGKDVGWAELAAELGFTDQAHLTREFKQAFGVPPQEYAERQRVSAPG